MSKSQLAGDPYRCASASRSNRQAILYGSRAKGNFRPGSGIDLTLKGDLAYRQLLRIETELDDLLLPYKIDLSLYELLDNPALIEHIDRAGKLFYTASDN